MSEQDEKTPLEGFVRATIEGATAGFPDGYRLAGPIKFKMSVVSTKEGEAGAKLYVVNLGGKYESQELKEVEFEVTNAEDPEAHMREAEKNMIKRMGL